MRKGVAAAALMLTALAASQARADTVADFYRGKQINLIVAALERIEKAPPQLLDYLRKLFAESKG